MSLDREHEQELRQFPQALRDLIEAELAAGNSIVEVGHSFPAPPAGAYFKLAKKVTSRPRASGSGLDFYERNSSIYSGEFTDAKRFYFVLEPANPPPPEPDMNAIRLAAQGKDQKTDDLTRLAERDAGALAWVEQLADQVRELQAQMDRSPRPPRGARLPPDSVVQSLTPTSARWLLHFQDRRSPREIEFLLERHLMALMPPKLQAGKLVCQGNAKITGASYSLLLVFEAARLETNCYSLRIDASWADLPSTHHDYYRKTSAGWFELWTREFQRARPPQPGENLLELYQLLCEAALKAEAELNSAASVQKSIVEAMKLGASFATAHKEGGTNIYWQNGRFIRREYGESEARQEFADETEFLQFLRQFYDWEVSKSSHPNKIPDLDAWKLILRLLRT